MKGIPIEHLFPKGAKIYQGGAVNIEALIEKYTVEMKETVEALNVIREQATRLQVEEKRLNEVGLRLEGCLHALNELASYENAKQEKPLQMVPNESLPSEEVDKEEEEEKKKE